MTSGIKEKNAPATLKFISKVNRKFISKVKQVYFSKVENSREVNNNNIITLVMFNRSTVIMIGCHVQSQGIVSSPIEIVRP